jgi:hypothetical protein
MKQYPWKFKLCWDGIEWYQTKANIEGLLNNYLEQRE